MSFEEKLDIVLKEIANIHGLSAGEVNILKRNAVTRYNMYKDIKPNINKEETTFLRNTSDFGDVLINRLINNIRTYSLSRQFDSNINTKGSYTAKNQELKLESPASIKAVTMNKLSGRIPNVSEETIQKCVVKVFDHELGHVFQRAFTGEVGYSDSKFNQLVNNLTVKYPNIFENKNSGDLKTIQGGMIPRRKDDSRQDIRNFYSTIALDTHLDEIFNDSEATVVVGQTTPQFQYDHGNGLKQNIYNYESSYYRVTNHADMMKLLMGKVRTYRSMYEDSIETYEFFDQFIDESNKAFANTKYAGKAPMLNVLNALDEAKNQKSTSASLRLDLFLTMCLQKKVAHELSNPNIDLPKLNEVVAMIKQFDSKIIKSDNHRLASEHIIAKIKEKVDAKFNELKKQKDLTQNTVTSNQQISSSNQQLATNNQMNSNNQHPNINNQAATNNQSSTNNDVLKDTKKDINKNDISELYKNMIILVRQNLGKNLKSAEKKQLVSEFLYYEGYLINALKTTQDIHGVLTKIVNDFGNTAMEKYLQNIILEDLQQKNSQLTGSKVSEVREEKSNDYSDIKKELEDISIRYHEMLSDRTIDDKELGELISKINVLDKKVLLKHQTTKEEKSKAILEEIFDAIFEEKRKMEKLQMGIDMINDANDITRTVTI